MRTLVALITLSAAGVCLTGAEKPRISRAAMLAAEKSIDRRLLTDVVDSYLLLGQARGVYLEGYGAAFTAEINLAAGAAISPFHPRASKEEIAQMRQKKMAKMPVLRKAMREMLVDTAGMLDTLPPEEQVVVGVTLVCMSWEDGSGMPSQIVMQAPRKTLLEFQTGRRDRATLESAVVVREF